MKTLILKKLSPSLISLIFLPALAGAIPQVVEEYEIDMKCCTDSSCPYTIEIPGEENTIITATFEKELVPVDGEEMEVPIFGDPGYKEWRANIRKTYDKGTARDIIRASNINVIAQCSSNTGGGAITISKRGKTLTCPEGDGIDLSDRLTCSDPESGPHSLIKITKIRDDELVEKKLELGAHRETLAVIDRQTEGKSEELSNMPVVKKPSRFSSKTKKAEYERYIRAQEILSFDLTELRRNRNEVERGIVRLESEIVELENSEKISSIRMESVRGSSQDMISSNSIPSQRVGSLTSQTERTYSRESSEDGPPSPVRDLPPALQDTTSSTDQPKIGARYTMAGHTIQHIEGGIIVDSKAIMRGEKAERFVEKSLQVERAQLRIGELRGGIQDLDREYVANEMFIRQSDRSIGEMEDQFFGRLRTGLLELRFPQGGSSGI